MKKMLLTLAVVATLSACKKNPEETPNPNPGEKPSADIAFTVKGATQEPQLLYKPSEKYSFLGNGYDVTDKFNDAVSVRANVVDIPAYNASGSYRVNLVGGTEGSWTTILAEDAVDLSKRFSRSFKETNGSSLFGNTIDKTFEGTAVTDKKYIYGYYSYYMIWKRYNFYGEQERVNNFLTAEFKRDISLLTAQELVNRYGTHVLAELKTGSKFDVIYQAEAPQNGRRSAIVMEGLRYTLRRTFGLPTGYLDEPNLADLNNNTSAQIYYSSTGGDISKLKTETINNRLVLNINNWLATTTEDKARFIGASDDGLVPIYKFINDEVIKAQVKTYIDRYLAEKAVKLLN